MYRAELSKDEALFGVSFRSTEDMVRAKKSENDSALIRFMIMLLLLGFCMISAV